MTRREWLMVTIIPMALGAFIVLAWQASVMRTPAPVATNTPPIVKLRPSPDLNPQQVVKIMMHALGNNNTPEPDSGIKTVYRFASPKNRKVTGPLDRFTRMIKTPQYLPMIMPNKAEYMPIRINGDRAGQHVRLTIGDRTVTYMIALTKQNEGKYAGCWMADTVMVVDVGATKKKTSQPTPQDDNASAI